ncbi:MAG: GTPase ObgE [Edaphobacter sp.]|uniref:GTPase ObgE n=1 Tax=Edaphobacter sp. TaxID=1934404 RepID=UPI00238D0EE6|nr:GTPase ObgE [Edaphobacter sp.]MDE1176742.1 GTPase ObgE [Edaphobacter sp.]
MFIDEAKIRLKAGDGGNGCMAFRREKFVPRGGPSGGDGGHGGDILMTSSLSHNTLVHFRFNPEHKSERGEHGMGSNMSGHSGEPMHLRVPVGTLVYDQDTGELLHDFTQPDQTIIVARGGRGGRGNQHFATSTHQAPREHELGRSGEERNLRLELRLLADAGLVGYPNVGKSTLISRLSAARPKIANYAFTTLEPNLGVVKVGDFPHEQSFTIADLPGLIEGAHSGAGLGIQFLKHIERTSVIVHLIDISDGSGRLDPVDDFKVITAELASFDPELPKRPTILVASKADVANPDKLKKLTTYAKRRKMPLHLISAVTGEGIEPLKYAIAKAVAEHRPAMVNNEPSDAVKPKAPYPPPFASARRSRK